LRASEQDFSGTSANFWQQALVPYRRKI